MNPTWPKEGTQGYRLLMELLNAEGDWVNGRYFLRELYFSQYHYVIHVLEKDYNWPIEHSDFKDEHGFKSYRIAQGIQPKLL